MFINYSILSKSELFSKIPVMEIPNAVKCLQGFTKNFSSEEAVYKSEQQRVPGIVLSGKLSVSQLFPDGSTVLIRMINPGELFGVFSACDVNKSNFVTAIENSSVLFLRLPVCQENVPACNCTYRSVILENLIKILITNNVYLNQKIKIISRPTIREKLLEFFMMQSKKQNSNTINLNMTREKLADYLCTDRSALCRELGKMQKEKIIRVEGKSVEVLG